jgi:peptidyl-prolyl cis-trans isomerase B (cyclophilin B)
MNLRLLLPFVVTLGLIAGCSAGRDNTVVMHTSMGDITLRLYDHTPKHKENFLRLVENHFYDSLLFHRIIRDFMVQGGDPLSKNAQPGALVGSGSPGYDIPAEIKSLPIRGALAAARFPDAINPGRLSNGSQFFIVQGTPQTEETLAEWEKRLGRTFSPEARAMYLRHGGSPQLDGQYTVFGEVVSGMDVVDKLAALPTDANDRPLRDVKMWME